MAVAAPATGRVIAITGPVVDIEFPAGQLPAIFNAVEIQREGDSLVCEVQQHLGNNWVRALTMADTDGLRRGAVVFRLCRLMVPHLTMFPANDLPQSLQSIRCLTTDFP